jgi:hypothetical protein
MGGLVEAIRIPRCWGWVQAMLRYKVWGWDRVGVKDDSMVVPLAARDSWEGAGLEEAGVQLGHWVGFHLHLEKLDYTWLGPQETRCLHTWILPELVVS